MTRITSCGNDMQMSEVADLKRLGSYKDLDTKNVSLGFHLFDDGYGEDTKWITVTIRLYKEDSGSMETVEIGTMELVDFRELADDLGKLDSIIHYRLRDEKLSEKKAENE